MDEQDGKVLRRWISVGDVIVLVTSLIALGISYGQVITRIDAVQDDVTALKNRDITPGALQRTSVLEARMAQAEAQIQQQRIDAADARREILGRLDRIEEKIDAHMSAERK